MKFALICFGNEESYGLLYAGTEFKRFGEIKFFDAEMSDPVKDILEYKPDYICFSPMTTFFPQAKDIEARVKERLDTISIYGGHHATNCGTDCGDVTVRGSVHGFYPNQRGIVDSGATVPEDLKEPARAELFRDIPRMQDRYRKVMLSVVGCPFHCTYCSSKHTSLDHRNIEDVLEEARFIKSCTDEIEWVDDDVFAGNEVWLKDFYKSWQDEINLPMYVSTTSLNALKAPDSLLKLMRKSVNCIGMGVQAIRPDSLKLLGRSWDSESQIKAAYDRLTSYGFKVNLQAIVGLPLEDTVEDALDTIEGLIRIGKGCIASIYPLQIYPNTPMKKFCELNGWALNSSCIGDTNTGMPGIDFGYTINRKLQNLCKLSTMAVKFGIERGWLESLLNIDLKTSSQALSMIRYEECVRDRLPETGEKVFEKIRRTTNVRF